MTLPFLCHASLIFKKLLSITLIQYLFYETVIVIIMVISKCYFSREHIALSLKNGVNMELGKTNILKALCMVQNHT